MRNLSELRKDAGLSRSRVAADLDMSERHLYRLETGEKPIRLVLAHAFANYYGVAVDEIDGVERVA